MRRFMMVVAGILGAACVAGAGTQPLSAGVAATVNGQAIQTTDVDSTLRKDLEPELRDQIRQQHLQRMVAWALIQQALVERKMALTDGSVQAEVAKLTKTPPLMSCGCCGYNSIDEYMQVNRMSDEDVRLDIKRDLGLGLLVQDEWKRTHVAGDQAANSSQQNEAYRQKYRKVWQVFTTAPEEVPETPDGARKSKAARARLQEAQDALAKGASFQDVARQFSQDASSASKGGALGYMSTKQPLLGIIDSKRWPALEMGKVQGPYRSWVGYHLILIQALSDEDVQSLMKQEFENKATDEIWNQILTHAQIEPADLMQK